MASAAAAAAAGAEMGATGLPLSMLSEVGINGFSGSSCPTEIGGVIGWYAYSIGAVGSWDTG